MAQGLAESSASTGILILGVSVKKQVTLVSWACVGLRMSCTTEEGRRKNHRSSEGVCRESGKGLKVMSTLFDFSCYLLKQ